MGGNLTVTGSLTYTNVSTGNFIPSANGQLLGNSGFGWWDAYLFRVLVLS